VTEGTESAGAPPASQRPAIVEASPAVAARQVAPDKPCPVCGAWLERGTVSGRTAGLPGMPQLAARCSTCGFNSGPLVSLGALVGRAAAIVFVGALVGKLGLNLLATKPLEGILLVVVAILSPGVAWLDARRIGRRLADRIAGARARWTREKEEHDFKVEPRVLLDATKKDANCPVCGKAPLEGPAPNALWSRGNLRCPRCRLDVPLAFTETGFVASLVVAALLAVGGALVIKSGLNYQGNDFVYRVLVGLGIFGAGVYLGFMVQTSGDQLALMELERNKRRFERRKRGLPVREDEEEPALWFQENLEAVVVAVILALIIRHFVMEAFVIPTGSMAPTLLGDHFQVACKNCHYPFTVAKREGDMGRDGEHVEFRCPLCGVEAPENQETFHYPDVCGGNKILVNKFLYHFSPPERWNVIVFKYPKDPLAKNFIKRLVGLPGETLRIDRRGDLFVKAKGATEFKLARKPRSVQDELWMPVYDALYPDLRTDPRAVAWKPEDDPTRWVIDHNSKGEVLTAKPGAGLATLDFQKEIRDHYGYNPSSSRSWGHDLVGDVRVRATVTPDKDCKAIQLSTVENHRAFTVEIPVGTGDAAILASNVMTNEIKRWPCRALPAGSATDVALGYADERLTLIVNGETVFEWDDPAFPAQTDSSSVRLGCVGPGGARFENVKIDRDLYYTTSGSFDPSSRDLEVPEGCYFVMGDNSPNSQDGRVFGFVKEPHLIGRAFLVFWPIFEVKLIR
jgi:signal peptidase I